MCTALQRDGLPSRDSKGEELMPYIKQDRRDELEEILWLMKKKNIQADGDLNYLLYAFCVRYTHESYNNYKNFIGELNECAAEIRRRLLAPYEDQKILDNGDIE